MRTPGITLSLALLLGCGASPAPAASLPKAKTILDKFVAATGGKRAYRKRHTDFSSGTVEISGVAVTGTVFTYHAEPNFSYMEMTFPIVGKARQGTDGNIAWSVSPSGDAKLKQGDERAMSIMAGRINADLHWRKLYKRVETAGTEEIDGKDAYIVVVTPKQGKPFTEFFDVRSHLRVKVILPGDPAGGAQRTEIGVGDFHDAGAALRGRQR